MLMVNLSDGTTLKFDLDKDHERKMWEEWSTASDFQTKIRGIGVLHDGNYYSVPIPKRFKRIQFFAERVFNVKKGVQRKSGERVTCHCDEIKIDVLVYTYKNPPPPIRLRLDISRIGKQMFPAVGMKRES